MTICELCKVNYADKKNTHFLTDGIIRSCLNLDGSVEREKGFYFDVSSDSAFIEFNFQRGTSVDKLKEALGRLPTDEEIERAKSIPFSVDNVFCNECEKHFTKIESAFLADILPQFRNKDLSNVPSLTFDNVNLIRLFFYLQIWRTSICDDTFTLTEVVSETLRKLILDYPKTDENQTKGFPLTITYLQTIGENEEFTTNFVGYTNDINPNLIILNDFVIQFYEKINLLKYFDFYGLNSEADFLKFVNHNEDKFIIGVINNVERQELLKNIITKEKVKKTLDYYSDSFNKLWYQLFGIFPPLRTNREYVGTLIGQNEFNILKYTRDYVLELTAQFILSKIK